VSGYTRQEVAQRAGVDPDYLDRLVELGILTPAAGDAFSPGDALRARWLQSLERAGVPLEGLAAAVRDGVLSFSLSVQGPPVNKGSGWRGDLLLVVGWMRSAGVRGQGGAPAAPRGRTTLTPARAVAGSGQPGQGSRVSASGPPPGRMGAAMLRWRVRVDAQPYLGPRTQGPAT
jgi:hypothetical protein